jgi:uncharacterized lipoprotein
MPTAQVSGRVLTVLCVLMLLSGCSSVGPQPSPASSAAQRFHEALSANRPEAACDLLAPGTLKELEQSADAPCPQALADAGVPQTAKVTTTDIYGTNARVVLGSATSREADTVFLARFGTLWKVTAAGCKPQPGLPYDCDVKGS